MKKILLLIIIFIGIMILSSCKNDGLSNYNPDNLNKVDDYIPEKGPDNVRDEYDDGNEWKGDIF